jgi:hypothetical protein
MVMVMVMWRLTGWLTLVEDRPNEEEEEEGLGWLVPGPALARFCGTGAQMFRLEKLTLGAVIWLGSWVRS